MIQDHKLTTSDTFMERTFFISAMRIIILQIQLIPSQTTVHLFLYAGVNVKPHPPPFMGRVKGIPLCGEGWEAPSSMRRGGMHPPLQWGVGGTSGRYHEVTRGGVCNAFMPQGMGPIVIFRVPHTLFMMWRFTRTAATKQSPREWGILWILETQISKSAHIHTVWRWGFTMTPALIDIIFTEWLFTHITGFSPLNFQTTCYNVLLEVLGNIFTDLKTKQNSPCFMVPWWWTQLLCMYATLCAVVT